MTKTYDCMTAEEYYTVIVRDNEGSAEAAYKLLHKQLYRRLRNVYQKLGGQRIGELDDTLDDFFLYLYEGGRKIVEDSRNVEESRNIQDSNNIQESRNVEESRKKDDDVRENEDGERENAIGLQKHFKQLVAVRCPSSFFSWTIHSYRNFLTVSLRNENVLLLNFEPVEETGTSTLTEEEKINHLAAAIAYMDQTCKAENKFLLYRWLLSFLDKSLAIECEEICKIIETSTVAYRVRTARQHTKLLIYIEIQSKGGELQLDVPHLIIRDEIIDGFDRLYQLLIKYYEQAIEQHPKAREIQALRQQYDFRLHETPSKIVSNPVDILEAILRR